MVGTRGGVTGGGLLEARVGRAVARAGVDRDRGAEEEELGVAFAFAPPPPPSLPY